MMKCTTCPKFGTEVRVVKEYQADILGAPFPVLLFDAVQEHWCTVCNKKLHTTVPDPEGLLQVVAQTRAVNPRKLSGPEIKFLRHAIGLQAKQFAKKLEMTAENLSRVEKGTKPLGPQSEKLLRFYVLTRFIDENLATILGKERIDKIFDMKIETFWNPDEPLRLSFVRRKVHKEQGSAEDSERYELAA